MAEFRSDIYFQQQPPDILGSVERGLKMSDLLQARQAQRAEQEQNNLINEAIAKYSTVDPSGNVSVNQGALLSQLTGKVPASKLMQVQQQVLGQQKMQVEAQSMQREQVKKMIDDGMPALLAAKQNPNVWPAARAQLLKLGFKETDFPEQYDPAMIDQNILIGQDVSKKLEMQEKQERIALTQAQTAKTRAEISKIGAETAQVGKESSLVNKDILRLPGEEQILVKDIAQLNAKKLNVKTQLDAVLSNLDSMTEAQKLQKGRELLKVINSPLGADAIGVEEAKRLGSKLEIALGGITSGNYGQFGRDVEGFYKDAKLTSDGLGSAISQGNQIIKKAYKKVGIERNADDLYKTELQQENEKQTQMKDPDQMSDAEVIKAYEAKFGKKN